MDHDAWKRLYHNSPNTHYAFDGLSHLLWHGGDDNELDYIVCDNSSGNFVTDTLYTPKPPAPPRAKVAIVGQIAFHGFALQLDASPMASALSGPSIFGIGSAVLQDPEPLKKTSSFKKAWNDLASLCRCTMGIDSDISTSSNLFVCHQGVPGLVLKHEFLVVRPTSSCLSVLMY